MGTTSDIPAVPASDDTSYRYDAFISYRHVEPDRRWAKWLHTSLETYRVPKALVQQRGLPARIERVFRDEEELPASADLNKEIETALAESRFLIVICSPRTPASEWVNKEVLRFREMGRNERILALLIEGEPAAAFPPALREIRRTITDASGLQREQIEEVEPLAADVRPSRHESQGHLVRMAKLRLLACIFGCRFDDLRQREQERRARRLARLGLAAMVLVVVMTALTVFAFKQRRAAIANAQKAHTNEQRAVLGENLANTKTAEAQVNAQTASKNERTANLRLAEGFVSQGDTLQGVGRYLEARQKYWNAFDGFAGLNTSSLRAEAALCVAFAASAPPLLSLEGHAPNPAGIQSVSGVAFSPDGRSAVSCGADTTLRLWDLPTGRLVRTIPTLINMLSNVAVTPDGRFALSIDVEGVIRLWDLQTGNEIRQMQGRGGSSGALALSPDGRIALAGGTDYSMGLWDVQTGKKIGTFSGHREDVDCVAFSPDGLTALSGSEDKTLKLWDLKTHQEIRTFTGHDGAVRGVAVSPDGLWALSGGDDNTVRLWDIQSGKELRAFHGHAENVTSVAFAPDGLTAISASHDKTLRLWDLKAGREIRTLAGHTDEVSRVVISPDGRTALSGSGDGTAKLWDLRAAREIRFLRGDIPDVKAVAFTPDSRLVLATTDRTPRLADFATGNEIPTGLSAAVCVAFTHDGRTAMARGADGTLQLLDVETGKLIRSLPGQVGKVQSVAFSADGRISISLSGEQELNIWDLHAGALIHSLPGLKHPSGIPNQARCVAISPDGHTVLLGHELFMLSLWDVQSGRVIRTLEKNKHSVTCVAFSPDGRTALSGSYDFTLALWDLQTGKEIHTFAGHRAAVLGVAFNPDGRTALSAGYDHTVKLWDLQSGEEIRTLEGHTREVLSVAFDPTGHAALSGGNDRSIIAWDFARIPRYHDFNARIPQAQLALKTHPDDAQAIALFAQWWAFRGKNDWAIELFEKARAAGVTVDPTALARCYWESANDLPPKSPLNREDCLSAAEREFSKALAAATNENDRYYLRQCLAGVKLSTTMSPEMVKERLNRPLPNYSP